MQPQLVQQEADLSRLSRPAVEPAVEGLHRLNLDREQVLNRLWEISNLSPGMTRGSITGQVKALSMIVAMQNFIPGRLAVGRLAVSSENKFAPTPGNAACPARQQAATIDPQPSPAPAKEEDSPSQSNFANRLTPTEAPPPPLRVPLFNSVPDLGVPFPIKNPFVHTR